MAERLSLEVWVVYSTVAITPVQSPTADTTGTSDVPRSVVNIARVCMVWKKSPIAVSRTVAWDTLSP